MHHYKLLQLSCCFLRTIIFLFSFCNICTAQDCKADAGFWNDYAGKLGEKEIQLSYFTNDDGSIIGNYRFIKNENIVYSFEGKQIGCDFFLTVYDNKNESAGSLTFSKSPDNLNGNYKGADGNTSAINLRQKSAVGGTVTQRYFELFGTTSEVDSFAAKIKTAFINNDKQWLAAHCRYPLDIFMVNHKTIIVKNEKAFIANYKKYFSQAYRDRFKKMACYNMFSNHVGAMMGKGEVWMNHTLTSTAGNYQYCITALNVF